MRGNVTDGRPIDRDGYYQSLRRARIADFVTQVSNRFTVITVDEPIDVGVSGSGDGWVTYGKEKGKE